MRWGIVTQVYVKVVSVFTLGKIGYLKPLGSLVNLGYLVVYGSLCNIWVSLGHWLAYRFWAS